MSTVQPEAEKLFVGLDDAESARPERFLSLRTRAENTSVVALLIMIQLAWFAAFGYAAYRFIF